MENKIELSLIIAAARILGIEPENFIKEVKNVKANNEYIERMTKAMVESIAEKKQERVEEFNGKEIDLGGIVIRFGK